MRRGACRRSVNRPSFGTLPPLDDTLATAPASHRPALRRILQALRELQGRGAMPREHRIIEARRGVYDLRMFAYPLGVTAEQMRAVERMPHVTKVEVSFAMAGTMPDVYGALCVQVNLVDGKRHIDIEDDATPDPAATRRRVDAADDAGNNSPGWIARLWDAFL